VLVTVLPIAPVPVQAVASSHRRLALVCVTRDDGRDATPAGLLRSVYGLTKAEAEIASRVAAGADAREIAEQLQVSRATVRNQITAAMQKMDVHRQAEMVAKISSLAPKLKLGRNGTG
jgi:DNA-binding CsgD family transcriptional regulator